MATPVKVTKLKKGRATVEALGQELEVDISLLKGVRVGDYLLAKGELAIQKLPLKEAEKILKLVAECDHQHNVVSWSPVRQAQGDPEQSRRIEP